MDELRNVISTFEDPLACNQCPYTTTQTDNLAKHLALGMYELLKKTLKF